MTKEPFFEDIRREVLDRDNHECTVCGRGQSLPVRWLTVERVYYYKPDTLDNLITLCATRKGLCDEQR